MLNLLLLSAATAATAAATADIPEDDQIFVSASPLARTGAEVLTPTSVLTGDELARHVRSSLGETLRLEPGISSTFFGAGASRPIIRGLDADRIRTLTNGIGSIDAAAVSPDHATPIDPILAESIEIVRGTGLLRYGSSAAGGVVNVIDGRIPSEVPEDGIEGAARIAATTVDEGTEFSAGGSALLGQVGGVDVVFTAQGSLRNANDFDIPGFAESARLRALEEAEEEEHEDEDGHEEEEEARDTLENSFVDYQSVAAGLSFIGDRGFFGFSVQNTQSEYGLPAGHGHGEEEEHEEEEEHDEEEEEAGGFIDLEQTRVDVNAGLDLDNSFISRVNFFGGYADYEHVEFEAPGEAGTVFTNEGYEFRTELVQQQRGNWRGVSGVQYVKSDFSAIGEEAFINPNTTKQWGFFSFQELTFGDFVAEASWRFEDTEYEEDVNGFERGFQGFSAALGGSYKISDAFSATGNVFRTVRAPTAVELFADGPHLATDTFEIGNRDLEEETAVGIEGGLRFSNDLVTIGFNAFYTDYEDFIYQAFTGETGADILLARGEDDEEELEEFGELAVTNFVASDVSFVGFELFGEAEFGQVAGVDLSGDLVIDYVEADLDEAGNDNLPRIPPLGIVAGLDAEMGRANFRAEVDYAAEADDTAEFELATDSYTAVNLYADFAVTERVTFEVSALNVGDEEIRLHTSFLKDEVPLPGRNFRFALRVDL